VDQEAHLPVAVVEFHQQLRACCSIQAVLGLLAQARYSMRRLPIERKASTYRRHSQTVSTVKKSQARVESACAWRKACHRGQQYR
jgi:hypothetical protein